LDPQAVLWKIGAAALAAGVLLFVLWQPWRSRTPGRFAAVVAAFVIAAGYGLGHYLLDPWLEEIPPTSFPQWLPWIGVAAAAATLVRPETKFAIQFGLRLVIAALFEYAMLSRLQVMKDDPARLALHVAAWAFGWAVLTTLLVRSQVKKQDARAAAALLVTGIATSVSILLCRYAQGAQFAGVLCAAIGPALVFGLWNPTRTSPDAVAGVGSSLLVGLLTLGRIGPYPNPLPLVALALLAIAPLVAALPLGRSPRWATFWSGLLAALIAGGGVAATRWLLPPAPDDSYGY